MLRWYSNRGRAPDIYFYRDHQGREVDFVVPVGDKLKLFECKWSETPGTRVKGFEEISRLIGGENVLDRTIVTPARGSRQLRGLYIGDSVEWPALGESG